MNSSCAFPFPFAIHELHVSHGPFLTTGNGYFSVWASFIFSSMYAYECNTHVRDAVDKTVNAVSSKPADGTDTWGKQPESTSNPAAAENVSA